MATSNGRPRVTVGVLVQPFVDAQLCSPLEYRSPGLRIELDFDLHDHETALAILNTAADKVRAQIEETR